MYTSCAHLWKQHLSSCSDNVRRRASVARKRQLLCVQSQLERIITDCWYRMVLCIIFIHDIRLSNVKPTWQVRATTDFCQLNFVCVCPTHKTLISFHLNSFHFWPHKSWVSNCFTLRAENERTGSSSCLVSIITSILISHPHSNWSSGDNLAIH